jgi:hypothetical protein
MDRMITPTKMGSHDENEAKSLNAENNELEL